MEKKPVRKAVFPVAGMGTRFLPATKATPKEMLPVVDKPLIQYAVEEAVEAGIEEIIFVTSSNKRAIEDHFDRHYELEQRLADQKKEDLLSMVRGILPSHVQCAYVRQAEPLGLGHAVLCAKALIGDEPFAVLLADDLIHAPVHSCLAQMMTRFQSSGGVVAVMEVPEDKTPCYGIVAMDEEQKITRIVEKPKKGEEPSRMAVVGRYILDPHIFSILDAMERPQGKELQLTDAIAVLLKTQHVVAHAFQGVRYDCGDKLGFLKATLDYALRHPQLGTACKAYLAKRFSLNDVFFSEDETNAVN